MGLDVYLYHYKEDPETVAALEKDFQQKETALWEASGSFTQDQLSAKAKTLAEQMGLDEYGESLSKEEICFPSTVVNREHLFKVGYFRSSYNYGGINTVLQTALGKDLYWIFEPREEYQVLPDWKACLERAEQLASELNEAAKEAPYRVLSEAAFNYFAGKPTQISRQKALEIFLEEKKRHLPGKLFSGDYSNSHGSFFFEEPLKVVGVVHGVNSLKTPCLHLIYEADLAWYQEAVDIVVETCKYVLSQPDPERYVLHWSA